MPITITHASDPTLTGREGIIIDETRNMFTLRTATDKEIKIQKHGMEFELTTPTGKIIIISDGLRFRPEDRIKRLEKKWQRAVKHPDK